MTIGQASMAFYWPNTHTQIQRGGQKRLTSREAHSTNNAINQSIQETEEGVDTLVFRNVQLGNAFSIQEAIHKCEIML